MFLVLALLFCGGTRPTFAASAVEFSPAQIDPARVSVAVPAFAAPLTPLTAPSVLSLNSPSIIPRLAAPLPRPTVSPEIPEHMRAWMHAEQKLISRDLDEKKIIPVKENPQDPRYSPERGEVFDVKSYWLESGQAKAFLGDGLPEHLRDTFIRTLNGLREVRLLVHPESESFYAPLLKNAQRAEDFRATATSSSRSLLVWAPGREKDAFFAKLSLNAKLGGSVRTIPKGEVARSIGINNILAADKDVLPPGFKTIPEVLGVVPEGMERGGMIIRAIPDEVRRGDVQWVPLFSLYARPPPGGPTLLEDMVQRSSLEGAEFVRTRILRPFIEQWLDLTVHRGTSMEPHAQNVLIELGKDGLPTGAFVHRDFGGFNADLKSPARPGVELPVVTTREKDYLLSEHAQSLKDSLHTYFVGGFIYNLDRNFTEWAGKGFERVVMEEFETAYRAMTGRSANLRGDLRNAADAVYRARRKGLKGLLKAIFGGS